MQDIELQKKNTSVYPELIDNEQVNLGTRTHIPKSQIYDVRPYSFIYKLYLFAIQSFGPLLSITDLISNFYYLQTQQFSNHAVENLFVFFTYGTLVLFTIIWLYKLLDYKLLNVVGLSFKSIYRQALSQDPWSLIRILFDGKSYLENLCRFFIIIIGIIISPIAIIIMNTKEFLKAPLFGFLTEINLLPYIIQYQSGFVLTNTQFEQFKISRDVYFSQYAVYQRDMDKSGQQKIQQIQQLFKLDDNPLERSKQLQKESMFLNQLDESLTFNLLNQILENIRIIFKSMPLLIIKYINVITLNQWNEPYQKFSIIISIISISWSSFWFIIDIFENNIDPVMLIHNLRDERKLQFEKQNINKLLPSNIEKDIKVNLSLEARIPNINFIAYSQEFYFQTIDKFTFQTINKRYIFYRFEKYKFQGKPIQSFRDGSLMLYKCLGNIVLQLQPQTIVVFDLDQSITNQYNPSQEELITLLTNLQDSQIRQFSFKLKFFDSNDDFSLIQGEFFQYLPQHIEKLDLSLNGWPLKYMDLSKYTQLREIKISTNYNENLYKNSKLPQSVKVFTLKFNLDKQFYYKNQLPIISYESQLQMRESIKQLIKNQTGENINFGLIYSKQQFYYYDRFESKRFFHYLYGYKIQFYTCETLHVTIDVDNIKFWVEIPMIPIIDTIQALDIRMLIFHEFFIDSLLKFRNLTSLQLNFENTFIQSFESLSLLGRHDQLRILTLNLNGCFKRKIETIDFFKFIKDLKELSQLELQLRNLQIQNLDGLIDLIEAPLIKKLSIDLRNNNYTQIEILESFILFESIQELKISVSSKYPFPELQNVKQKLKQFIPVCQLKWYQD